MESSSVVRFSPRVGILFFLFLLFGNGCSVGPDYVKPAANVPTKFKEETAKNQSHSWKKAHPSDYVGKGDWWTVFGDPELNKLELEAEIANQNLKATVARVEEARATARITQADFFPNLNFDPSFIRTRISPNGPLSLFGGAVGAGSTATAASSTSGSYTAPAVPPLAGLPGITFTDYKVPFDLSYEIDLWGRVRRSFESAKAEAQATLADYENVLLTLQADVALNYFNLRSIDAQEKLLRETVKLREQAMNLNRLRTQAGLSTQVDVVQAEAEIHSSREQLLAMKQSRAQVEHALAILVGKSPSEFSMPPHPLDLTPPSIPPGLPSQVMERRPDIASAERKMAAANANIGVAQAAFFPVVSLTGQGGFESIEARSLFDWQSRIWSLGPSVSFPIFEGGRNVSGLKRARAAYAETAANYRQQILTALGEVEDSLSNIHFLAGELHEQNLAVKAARESANLTRQRYKAGLINYLEVVDADRIELADQLTSVQLAGQQMASTVQLIKAIGGGWQSSRLLPVLQAKKEPVLPGKMEQ